MFSRTQASSHVDTTALQGAPPADAPAAETAPLLPAPDMVSGDPVAMIAKLLVKSAQQKREGADLSAAVEEKAEDAADAQRIAAMKEKADKTFMAGMAAGFAQIGAGTCSIAGGALSLGKVNAGGVNADLKAKGVASIWDGSAGITTGLGKIQETYLKHEADKADQAIAKAESQAKVHKRAAEALHKEVDAASQHEGKVMQLLQEIKQAQQQCERAALLKMA